MRESPLHFRPIALLLPSVAAGVLVALAHAGEKVTVCHLPPGNPENPRTIAVGESAVGDHLDHGDDLGECDTEPGSCGDGVIQGSEGCDDPDFGDRTCEDVLGTGATGEPACTDACELATGSCHLCGNGTREEPEECDGVDGDCEVGPGFSGCDPASCLCDDDGSD